MWFALFLMMQPLTLDALRDRDLTVTIGGPAMLSFPSEHACVYWEWAAGEMRDGRWAVRIAGGHSGSVLVVNTSTGTLELPHGRVRLYLGAAAAHRYTRTSSPAAPGPLRPLLAEMDPLVVEEYVLESGRTYHARVEIETSMLPPVGPAPPERRRTAVLAISDLPFVNGQPQRPLTPSFVGFAR